MSRKKVVIIGAGGYTGAELAEVLLGHPGAEIVGLFGSGRAEAAGKVQVFGEVFPRFRGRLDLPVRAADADAVAALNPDAVFLATPHEASLTLAAELRARGLTVLDLSAAYRLKDATLYTTYYGFTHDQGALLREAVYGLPELHRREIAGSRMIAVPGCYPTSAILPLAPLAAAGAVRAGTRPIVDSISGVSGAGRAATARTHFCEVSVQHYGVLSHRHGPEIDAWSGTPVVFTPQIGPYDRGILSTIHVELAPGWNGDRVSRVMHEKYGHEAFVRLLPSGQWPSVGAVRGTNFCDIAWACDEKSGHQGPHLIMASAIDNLVKGAAGQAVQCMNLACGLPEGAGLDARQAESPVEMGVSR
jgi:N-acetyl-gamma-glutamyl-phosphate reductase